jgi:signal transduction histidine kinase
MMRFTWRRHSTWPWQLLVAVILLVLLASLATLQYRWLGEVSAAERERMRASLRTRMSEFTTEFDGDLTRTYVAFRVDGDQLQSDASGALGAAYGRWQSTSTAPALVRGVYLAEGRSFDVAQLRRFDPERRALEPAEWPPDLAASLRHAQRPLPEIVGAPLPMLLADAVDPRVPALIIAVPFFKRFTSGRQAMVINDPAAIARVVIVVLDADALRRQVVEPLVTKHFGDPGSSEYFVTIVRRDEPTSVVYSSGPAPLAVSAADVTSGLFDLRMDELNRLSEGRGGTHDPGATTDRVAITIVRRASGPDAKRVLMAGGEGQGAWQVRASHRGGSLDAIVARSRRRNLAISLGVLGLLTASVALIIAAAQRQQRLARQQMEFVAAVSHELRTPLAVICSAGENLADGVVADGPQVKRYGALIQTEGRRLRDMVERVMEFAGITSGTFSRARSEVNLPAVIAEAVDSVAADAAARGVTIAVRAGGELPPVLGDADALRSAVQNILGNAVKYSPDHATIELSADGAGSSVRIRVVDHGIGIGPGELPYIFKPFYRGRRAIDAQVRGTGVGLSVVRHVIESHAGTISVESPPGGGTTVTVDLPSAAASTTQPGETTVARPGPAASEL